MQNWMPLSGFSLNRITAFSHNFSVSSIVYLYWRSLIRCGSWTIFDQGSCILNFACCFDGSFLSPPYVLFSLPYGLSFLLVWLREEHSSLWLELDYCRRIMLLLRWFFSSWDFCSFFTILANILISIFYYKLSVPPMVKLWSPLSSFEFCILLKLPPWKSNPLFESIRSMFTLSSCSRSLRSSSR